MQRVLKSLYLWLDTELGEQVEPHSEEKINWLRCLPFVLTHVVCLGVFWVGASVPAVTVCLVAYALRVFALTGFYHRLFSHRAFKTSRAVQFIFAFIGCAAAQRGPLWWAAHHRYHHKHSDGEGDRHSPVTKGFLYSHLGWFLTNQNFSTQKHLIKDFSKYPELVFINRFDVIPPLLYGLACYLFGGWQMLIWGYFISTVMVYHVTFFINSLTHIFGKREYETNDNSRNHWLLALLTFGEGWHNNHHYYPSSARQGFKWYQIDITYMGLLLLKKLGLIWDIRMPPAELMLSNTKNAPSLV